MSFETDAMRGRLAVLRKELSKVRSLAEALRANLRQRELSTYGEIETVNTEALLNNVNNLIDAIHDFRQIQGQIDRLSDELGE